MRRFLCALVLIALAVPAFAADNFVGTWKMNAQKSSGPEVDPEGMLVAVDDGGMQSITVTGKAPDGSSFKTQFSVPLHDTRHYTLSLQVGADPNRPLEATPGCHEP